MKDYLKITATILVLLVFVSCQDQPSEPTTVQLEETSPALEPLVEKVLTAEEQANLTAAAVLEGLKAGNQRFMNNEITARDHTSQVRKSALGQYPKAVVLSCLDSRIPVEDVFDKGIGDIFVARVAGNFVNEDILGSMEFGCKVAGSKLILVMGHENCGAIKAAIDNVKLGNITAMLSKILPAVQMSQGFEGEKTTANADFVTHVGENNVRNTIERIRKESSILKEMEESGAILIVGAIYDMETGQVRFL